MLIQYVLSYTTLHRHVSDTSVTINRVSYKNTNNILFVFLYFICVHLLVWYIIIRLSLICDMEHINSHVYFTDLQ